ncbi:hypothetical protein SDC9_63728 [bioreactor metagenome]|uniref:Stage II sporulation protein P n=1 Tax=bioreactor metagenome TaxID=1076179 RepID=A0A644XMD7_9ZZZZ|nr:stage II sporulation protein P [Candidatus Metalachnospira sp.]
MQRWSFNYRLFFKKNMVGILVLAAFGTSVLLWDRGLLLKTIALSEVLPNTIMTLPTLNEIYAAEKDATKEDNAAKENDEAKEAKDDEKANTEPEKAGDDKTKEPEKIDTSKLFLMTDEQKQNYSNINYLKKNIYTVAAITDINTGDIDPEKFLNMDFSLDTKEKGPKVLIFHTHSHEEYSDSNMELGLDEGVVGVGEHLKQILEDDYGIETMHCTERFDYVDSKMTTTGAYERMEPVIEKILQDNPSIEIAIDIHRDGLTDESIHLVTNIDGKQTAQVMFFNGLCRVYEDEQLVPTEGLENPNLEQNLAFSFNMKYAADEMYSGFARKSYLNAYRYSLNMLPKSLLVEVGAQNNTKEEAMNAMEPLAKILVTVLNKNT